MKNRLFISLFVSIIGWAVMAPAFAGDLVVTRYFSGLWDQTHEESQGIVLHVVDQEEEGSPKAVAYWFTYGDDLQATWYMAIGLVEGNQVVMDLYVSGDVDFMQPEDSAVNPVGNVGTLTLEFKNCNKGTAYYNIIVEEADDMQGEFEISRLASLYNSRCSGGISDNTPGDAKPLMLEVALLPPEEGMEGKGKAKFWERADRSDFHVSAEDLADGEYEIHVCGINEGALMVVEGEGATQFRSPDSEGKLNLTFNPSDCPIEIQQTGGLFLTSGDNVLGGKDNGPDKDKKDRMKIEIELVNSGLIEDAEGEVEYEVKMNSQELEVEIEDVPVGSYGFYVDDVFKGTIEVTEDDEKGKLRFSDPQKGDWEVLDFEPWDMPMEVRNADGTILSETFPSMP